MERQDADQPWEAGSPRRLVQGLRHNAANGCLGTSPVREAPAAGVGSGEAMEHVTTLFDMVSWPFGSMDFSLQFPLRTWRRRKGADHGWPHLRA